MDFYERFRSRLDEVHAWPAHYLFKFIVPNGEKATLLALLPMGQIAEKPSQNGKYIAISLKIKAHNAEEVIAVYQRVAGIPGIVSL